MHILYVSDCYKSSSIYDSQVHSLCMEHAKYNKVTLMVLCNYLDWDIPNYANVDYEFHKYYKLPKAMIPLLNNMTSKLLPCRNLIINADIIHCKGLISTALALNLLKKYKVKKPVIADIRGDVVDELLNSRNIVNKFLAKSAKRLEKYVFQNAIFFFFVSEYMKQLYSDRYNLNDSNVAVFPTVVNSKYFYSDRSISEKIREDLNICKDDIVFTYSGGLDYWQNVDMLLESFARALKKQKNIFLLLLTKRKITMQSKMKNYDIERNKYLIVSSNYWDVGKYLNAADVGLLIRDKTITNLVACPIKLNEYLACGLDVITTILYYDDVTNLILVDFDVEALTQKMVSYRKRNGIKNKFIRSNVDKVVKGQMGKFLYVINHI